MPSFCDRVRAYYAALRSLGPGYVLSALLHMLDLSIPVADYAVLGRMGRGHAAAAFLGYACFYFFWFFEEGILATFDALEHGEAKSSGRGRRVYGSLVVVLLLSAAGTVIFMFAHTFMNPVFRAPVHMAVKANQHLLLLSPSLWLLGLQKIATKQLLHSNSYRPLLTAMAAGAVANLVLDYLFIYGFGLGFMGCGLATDVARLVILIVLFWKTRPGDVNTFAVAEVTSDLHKIKRFFLRKIGRDNGSSSGRVRPIDDAVRGTSGSDNAESDGLELVSLMSAREDALPEGQSRSETSSTLADEWNLQSLAKKYTKGLRVAAKYMVVGVPSGVLLLVEQGLLPVTALVLSGTGSVPLSTAFVMLTTSQVLTMSLAQPLASASAIQLSHLMGEGDLEACTRLGRIVVASSFIIMLIVGLLAYLFFRFLTFMVSTDQDVLYRISVLNIYIVPYAMAQACQVGLRGILRVANFGKEVHAATFLSLWVCGFATSYYLCFIARPTFELRGFLIGMLVGASLLTLSFLGMVLAIDWRSEVRSLRFLRKRGSLKSGLDDPFSSLAASVDGFSLGAVGWRVAKDLDDELDVLEYAEFELDDDDDGRIDVNQDEEEAVDED